MYHWTSYETSRLKCMSINFTAVKSAALLDRTIKSVYAEAAKQGFSFLRDRDFYAEDIALMMECRSKGMDSASIGKLLGVNSKKIRDSLYLASIGGMAEFKKRNNFKTEVK